MLEYLVLNLNGVVLMLVIEIGVVVCESSVIIEFVD